MCKQRKMDLILVKSISRFARNTVDCLNYIRTLKELGIAVYFEKENINTLSAESEMLITIMGAFAWAESKSISANVKWGKRKAMADGKAIIPYKWLYAYEKGKNGKTQTIPEQALRLNWTQNVVVMEANLSMEQRAWHLRACGEYGWSKSELKSKIDSGAHLEVSLDGSSKTCYNDFNSEQETRASQHDESAFYLPREYMQESDGGVCDEGSGEESGAGEGVSDRLRCHQHRGDVQRKSEL